MSSDKPIANLLADTIAFFKFKVVYSPGSRNAPLAIALNAYGIKPFVVVDERSAGFFALGMAQQTKEPVVLICTSGSAVLNYAPAIAEAYYQQIPLIIITADRPPQWIDKGDGQTIRQKNVYKSICDYNYQLEENAEITTDKVSQTQFDVFNIFESCQYNHSPVHINVPFEEPLYNTVPLTKFQWSSIVFRINGPVFEPFFTDKEYDKYTKIWTNAKKVMIVCGNLNYFDSKEKELSLALERLSFTGKVTILSESNSNLQSPKFISNIDGVIGMLGEQDKKMYAPDLLITFGLPVTSKRLKQWLRSYKPKLHWHLYEGLITATPEHLDYDIFLSSPTRIHIPGFIDFFNSIYDKVNSLKSGSFLTYSYEMLEKSKMVDEILNKCCVSAKFSDLNAFRIILQRLPVNSNVQLGNSSPIRYANLFTIERAKNQRFFSNRGVSGINGTVSTAVGAALVNDCSTTLIVGDLAFFYDSNALWNNYISPNLRIIVMNNGGGGIFRLIDGAKDSELLEPFFEVKHSRSAKSIADCYNIEHFSCSDEKQLHNGLKKLYDTKRKKPAILEVFTPNELNARVWEGYFKLLKK